MRPLKSPLLAFVRWAVPGLLSAVLLFSPEALFAHEKKGPKGERPRYEQRVGHRPGVEKSRHREYYGRHHHRYRHHDRFPRFHYYDRPSYYYDPPRQGFTIRF